MTRRTAAVVLAALAMLGAGVPNEATFQAELRNADGTPVEGAVDVQVAVWDAASEGTSLYSEFHQNVPVVDGVLSLRLGSGDFPTGSFEAATFLGQRFLSFTVEGELLEPRLSLASTPYAFEAAAADIASDAQTLAGEPASAFQAAIASCPAGSSIRAVAEDGSVACEVDDAGGAGDIASVAPGPGFLAVDLPPDPGLEGVVAFALDVEVVQRRVQGCPLGTAIRSVDADGNVDCQPDRGNSNLQRVSVASPLSGGGNFGAIQIGVTPNGIGSTQIATGGVIGSDLDDGAVTSASIRNGAVGGDELLPLTALRLECNGTCGGSLGAVCRRDGSRFAPLAVSCDDTFAPFNPVSCGGDNECRALDFDADSNVGNFCGDDSGGDAIVNCLIEE